MIEDFEDSLDEFEQGYQDFEDNPFLDDDEEDFEINLYDVDLDDVFDEDDDFE
ncbi:hypothetical protein GCM10027284_05580 [Cyclobacterium sediminis]